MPLQIPRRRQAPTPTKKEAAIGALTSLVTAKAAQPGKGRSKRKSAGGLALIAGLGAAAFKAKGRRSAAGTPTT
jgi:hypothetical protein